MSMDQPLPLSPITIKCEENVISSFDISYLTSCLDSYVFLFWFREKQNFLPVWLNESAVNLQAIAINEKGPSVVS